MSKKTEGARSPQDAEAMAALQREYPPFADAIRAAMSGMDARIAICVLADMMAEVAMVQAKNPGEARQIATSAAQHAAKSIARRWEAVKRQYLAPDQSSKLHDELAARAEAEGGTLDAGAGEMVFAVSDAERHDGHSAVQKALEGKRLAVGVIACMDSMIWYLACLSPTPQAVVMALQGLVADYVPHMVAVFPDMKAYHAELVARDGGTPAVADLAFARPAGSA